MPITRTYSLSNLIACQKLQEVDAALDAEAEEIDLDALAIQIDKVRIQLPLIKSRYRSHEGHWEVVSEPSANEINRAQQYLKLAKKYRRISDNQDSVLKKSCIGLIGKCLGDFFANPETVRGKRYRILSDAKRREDDLVELQASFSFNDV